MNSILDSIKKMLGMDSDYTPFDTDIIININSAFMVLNQLGIGPSNGFHITSNAETWDDYFGSESTEQMLESVKQYVYLKVRTVFDPPTNSASTAMSELIKELEWRLVIQNEDGGIT